MTLITALKPGSEQTPKFEIPDSFILFGRCGSLETPGITYLTPWGTLCALCNDDYSTTHGVGEEGF